MKQPFRRQSDLRSWILQLHLYGGLICSSYLVIYGISTLDFNHPNALTRGNRATVTWDRALTLSDAGDDARLAEQVRDALGLFGWPLSWTMRRDDDNNFHFDLARPGKRYVVRVALGENRVYVEEERQRLWSIIRGLHGLGNDVPGSRFLIAWGLFTEVTTWIVIFSALSGVYLWTFRRKERRVGAALTLGALGITLALFLYLILHG